MVKNFVKHAFVSVMACFALLPQGICAAAGSPVIYTATPKQAFYDQSFTIALKGVGFGANSTTSPIYITNGSNSGLITNNNLFGYNTLGFSVSSWSVSDPTKNEIDLAFHGKDYDALLQPWSDLNITIYGSGGKSNKITVPLVGHVSDIQLKTDQTSFPTDKSASITVNALESNQKNVAAKVSLGITSPSGKAKLSKSEVTTGSKGAVVTVSDPVVESVTITANYSSSAKKNAYSRTADTTVNFVKPTAKSKATKDVKINASKTVVDSVYGGSQPEINIKTPFPDVPSNYWAAKSIAALADKKIISGYPNGSFEPDQPVTRGQWASLLNSAFHLPEEKNPIPFSDVNKERWDYISIEKASHLIPFHSDAGFNPDEPIDREDATTSLVQAMGEGKASVDLKLLRKFSDQAKINNSAKNNVAIAVSKGLIKGLPDGTFRPQDSLTRAQSAAILYSAIQAQAVKK